ncbi:MAG: CHAT domain-containing protein, partial [Kamptonema sp. SIO4C4]|nr:CHAT domain-containing protein [Kamptonema sp. SIO4C4]
SSSNREVYPVKVSTPTTPTTTPTIPTDTPRLCPPYCIDEPVTTDTRLLEEDINNAPVINPIATVEEQYTRAYSEYWEQPAPDLPTLDEAQDILRQIEKETGVKPVLYYVMFVPQLEGEEIPISLKAAPKNATRETGNDYLELVLITTEGEPKRIPLRGVTRAEVMDQASELRRNLTNLNRPSAFVDASKQLYDWLIAPAAETLQEWEIENIAFILDEGLRSLPIAALSDGQQFLIERYSVGLMPSLALTDTDYVPIQASQVLAMGSDRFNASSDGIQLDPLPAVPLEVEIITEQLWKGRAYLDGTFTEQQLLKARSQNPYGIVHLATHGQFQAGQLGNSYIAFQNRLLTLPEIRDLKLYNPQVNLLVLSACRTALGDIDAELGFAGLAVGSGAKSALGSLWYISDRGTLAFMSHFYEQLRTAPIKAEALRQTQLSLLRGEVYFDEDALVTPQNRYPLPPELAELGKHNLRHPYFWSALTLIGSPW